MQGAGTAASGAAPDMAAVATASETTGSTGTTTTTPFSCPRCSTCVEVTKFSREHTLTRWVDGHEECPELSSEPERFGTGRCETLTAAVRAAFDVGLIPPRDRIPGT